MRFNAGDLVRVVNPPSIEEMGVVGIVITSKSPFKKWFEVWIPDISREICFLESQLKKIEQ